VTASRPWLGISTPSWLIKSDTPHFRFNRRHSRSRGLVFYRVMELAAGHDPVRYHDIRATRKPRSKPPQQRGTGHPPSLHRPAAARPWRTAEMQLQFPLRLSG
jgi:hypothetical protein